VICTIFSPVSFVPEIQKADIAICDWFYNDRSQMLTNTRKASYRRQTRVMQCCWVFVAKRVWPWNWVTQGHQKCIVSYLAPFQRNGNLLAKIPHNFTHSICFAPQLGVMLSEFRNEIWTQKSGMMGLSVGEKFQRYVWPFWYNTGVWWTDSQTDRHVDVASTTLA